MEQMMEQMGIDVEDIDAEEVIIRTDEYDLVFDDAEVTKMDARGQETYQVIGSPAGRSRLGPPAEAPGAPMPEATPNRRFRTTTSNSSPRKPASARTRLARPLKDNDGDLAAAVCPSSDSVSGDENADDGDRYRDGGRRGGRGRRRPRPGVARP